MPSKPDLDEFLATPAIWLPGMGEEEWNCEVEGMIQRTLLTRSFVEGEISPDDYLDGLHNQRIDVVRATKDWENGTSYYL